MKKTEREYRVNSKSAGSESSSLFCSAFNSINDDAARKSALTVRNGKVLVSEWREYFNLSQADVADKLGISLVVFKRLEKTGAKLRQNTVVNLGEILNLYPEFLTRM